MPYRILTWLLAVFPLMAVGCFRQNQQASKVRIDRVRIGYPAGAEPGEPLDERGRLDLFKPGAWTPMYVDLTVGLQGLVQAPSGKGTVLYEVVAETTDSDNIPNRYRVPLPNLDANQAFTAITYLKPGGTHDDVTVTVREVTVTTDGQRKKDESLVAPFKQSTQTLDLEEKLFLTLGPRLPKLSEALDKASRGQEGAKETTYSSPKCRMAYIDHVKRMPTRWYGYDSVDVLILTTGNKGEFLNELIKEQEQRKEALAEWVRRGGKLLVSTGRNADLVKKVLEQMAFTLPVEIKGKVNVKRLDGVEDWLGGREVPEFVNQPLQEHVGGIVPPIEVARLEMKPGSNSENLVQQHITEEKANQPLIVRASQGLGQFTLVAFDLDQSAFQNWGGQGEFWYKLLAVPRPVENAAQGPSNATPKRSNGGGNNNPELGTALENTIENFPDIPVISFGWVAFFIFIYILVVGPLDYLFLKKVVKRLELTWVTFPAVILVVSAVAYFSAYYLKGTDLKINKIDVIDMDLPGGKATGTTWFTFFSPRIQHYTIGVEPGSTPWAAEGAAGKKGEGVVVSWLGRPEPGFGGYGRGRSQGFFHSTYEYAPDGRGLTGVPIQVWATKSFTASWERPLDPKQSPFVHELKYSADDPQLIMGSVTNQLPVAVEDAFLLSGADPRRHMALALGTLLPDNPKRISFKVGEQGTRLTEWVPLPSLSSSGFSQGRYNNLAQTDQGPVAVNSLIRRVLFFDEGPKQDQAQNHSLPTLDQSWRLALRGQVILFGRLARFDGPAETVNQNPGNPSRLWLGQLPAPGKERPSLAGTMTQDTFVRIYLPVRGGASN